MYNYYQTIYPPLSLSLSWRQKSKKKNKNNSCSLAMTQNTKRKRLVAKHGDHTLRLQGLFHVCFALNSSGQLIGLLRLQLYKLPSYQQCTLYSLLALTKPKSKAKVSDTPAVRIGCVHTHVHNTHTHTHTHTLTCGDTCGYLSAARNQRHEKDPGINLGHANWISELLLWPGVSRYVFGTA